MERGNERSGIITMNDKKAFKKILEIAQQRENFEISVEDAWYKIEGVLLDESNPRTVFGEEKQV